MTKTKTIFWIWGTVLALNIIFTLLPTIGKMSWKWFWIPLLITIALGTVFTIILLSLSGSDGKPLEPKKAHITLDEAVELAKSDRKKDDEDEPDEIIVLKKALRNEGESGTAKTPIGDIKGHEIISGRDIFIAINLSDPKVITRAYLEREHEKNIHDMADNPIIEDIEEQIPTGKYDYHGEPIMNIKKTKRTKKEKEEIEKHKKEEEEETIG